MGHLRATHGLRIQQQRVVDAINRIDKLGQGMRHRVGKKMLRRKYSVPRPNTLWHIDGHHKLIAWGIVLHGVADGYTHKVCIYHAGSTYTMNLRLDRSLDFRQIQTTDQKLSFKLTCLLMQ